MGQPKKNFTSLFTAKKKKIKSVYSLFSIADLARWSFEPDEKICSTEHH